MVNIMCKYLSGDIVFADDYCDFVKQEYFSNNSQKISSIYRDLESVIIFTRFCCPTIADCSYDPHTSLTMATTSFLG